MTKILKKFKADEFARRIKSDFQSSEHSRYVFFLGAGCSISSGIPSAAGLVQQWLPKLKYLKDGKENGWEAWASKRFPGYSNNNPAAHYGAVIEDLFLQPDARQQEIERLTASKYPGFGYGALAQLMSHKDYGHRCHAVLTTNFDDLVADALYLYSHKKPLVVAHESLSRFVRPTRFSPLIVKLHGDAHLAPKNTTGETSTLDVLLQQVLKNLLLEKFDQTVIATRANLWISELSAGEKSRSFAFAQDDIVDGGSAPAGLDPPYFTHTMPRAASYLPCGTACL